MSDLKTVKNNIDDVFQQAKDSMDPNLFLRLGNFLEDLKGDLRERLQEDTKSGMQGVLEKLGKGQKIGSQDVDLLRLWIVGEAQAYIDEENNFSDWVQDLGRIIGAIHDVPSNSLDTGKVLYLTGLVHDARRSVADILNYLEKKERFRLFEEVVSNLDDPEKRAHLIGILKHKMISPDN